MKRYIAIGLLTVFFTLFFFQPFASAKSSDTTLLGPVGTTQTSGEGDGKLFSDDKMQQMEKDKDDASFVNGIMLGWILSLFKAVNVSSIPTLIFGNPYGDTGDLNYGIFSDAVMSKIVNPLLGLLTGLYALILTAAIMLSSAKFGLKAISPQAKADFWADINMWVLSAFFMSGFWLIFKVMMSLNLAFVSSMYDTLKATGIDTNGVSLIAEAAQFNIGNALVYLAEFGLTLYLNIIYISRQIIILFLVVLSPFAAYSLMFPKTRAFFGSWVKELAGNIFLQSIHALTIFVFAELSALQNNGVYGTIYRLGLLMMFIPITGMISRWLNLGDSSSKLGQTATIMGAGSVAGAMMLARGAGNMMGGKRVGGTGAMSAGPMAGGTTSTGTMAGGTGGAEMGSDGGITALTQAAKGGAGWQRFKQAAGIVGSVAGGTMGLTMGPAGVTAGAALGSKAMSGSAQAMRNISKGGSGAFRQLSEGMFPGGIKENFKNASGGNFKEKLVSMGQTAGGNLSNTMGNLANRRQFMGNIGESVGSMMGAGGFGRKVGHMMSGASRGRVQGASEMFGGFNDMNLAGLSQKYAGQNVSWEQTNMGSAFYTHGVDGSKQRISNYGAADPTLKKGETRKVDYKFPSINDNFQRQANGSYTLIGAKPGDGGTVGLPGGSNENILRTSGAYISGSDGARYVDNRVDAGKITPDNYFAHNIKGADTRDWSDKGADLLAGRNRRQSTEYSPPSDHSKKLKVMADQAERDRTRSKVLI
ncbi:hypothetical protein [Paenibacillus sp. Y412MC10]|uniref:hypothetical protein n=1 Tax=Geobacillus sp. (strain Y412MC10) TaxID=481743 RepID=UPI0011AB4DE2|nr:hypothetical protein [Paenibacillus sp. Y412MC10]